MSLIITGLTATGRAPLVWEYSISPTYEQLGEHDFTLELFWFDGDVKNGRGQIEWDIPTLEETEHIGIWTEDGALIDYDGVMSLPDEIIPFIEAQGITVPAEFRDDE